MVAVEYGMNDTRRDEMIRLRNDGFTLEHIGIQFSISRERVRQIIGNTGRSFRYERTKKILSQIPESELSKLTSRSRATLGINLTACAFRKKLASVNHAIVGSDSTTFLGQLGEQRVLAILDGQGIKGKLMPLAHPWDIRLLNGKTIDVKTCFTPTRYQGVSDRWGFNVDPLKLVADFHILFCAPIAQMFIVPSVQFSRYSPKTQRLYLCYPTLRSQISKFEKFRNAFHLLL